MFFLCKPQLLSYASSSTLQPCESVTHSLTQNVQLCSVALMLTSLFLSDGKKFLMQPVTVPQPERRVQGTKPTGMIAPQPDIFYTNVSAISVLILLPLQPLHPLINTRLTKTVPRDSEIGRGHSLWHLLSFEQCVAFTVKVKVNVVICIDQ